MYIKRDKISKIWPLLADTQAGVDSIDKFERTGTLPLSSNRTIANAIKFHNSIGSQRKQERLHYLKSYWTGKVRDIPGVTLNTPLSADRSCAIANVALEGYTAEELAIAFIDKYKISIYHL